MSTLDRWLLARFGRAFFTFAASAVLLFVVIDGFSNLDDLTEHGLVRGMTLRYGPRVPELLLSLSPFVTVAAALWVVANLLRSNELTPLYAAGFSPTRVARPLLLGGALIAPLVFANRELLLPALGGLRREASGLGSEGWERPRPIPDGDDGVLTPGWYLPATREIRELAYTRFREDRAEAFVVLAARAVPVSGGWELHDGIAIVRSATGDPRDDDHQRFGVSPGYTLETELIPDDVEASVEAPTYLSSAQLRAQLERTPGFKNLEVQLYERFTFPLAGPVLLLVCLPIALAARGGWDAFVRFVSCLSLAILYFLGSTISAELGAREVVSPATAAFLPLVVFACVGGVLTARSRR